MPSLVRARTRARYFPLPLRLVLALVLAWALAAEPAHAETFDTKLTQLPGDAGCFKGTTRLWMPCAPVGLGQFDASSIAISPDGKFAYVVSPYSGRTSTSQNIAGGTISAYARDLETGALRQLPGAAACIKDREAPLNAVTTPCQVKAIGLNGAKTIAMSPDGRNVYVASLNNSAIAAFARDSVTGALTQLPGADACIQDARYPYVECPRKTVGMAGVRWVEVSPDGKSVYASAPTSDGIVGLKRDPVTGGLTHQQCIKDRLARLNSCTTTGMGLNYPRSLAVSPDGKSVYVASDSADAVWTGDAGNGDAVSAFRRDPETGLLTQLPGAAACVRDRLSRTTAGCTTIGRGLLDAFHVTVSRDGKNVYVGSHASKAGAIAIFSRDEATGALTQLPGTSGCFGNSLNCAPAQGIGGVDAITLSPDGEQVWVTGFFSMSMALFNRDTTTGALAQHKDGVPCREDLAAGTRANCPLVEKGLNGPRTVAVSPDGKSVYLPSSVGGTIAVYRR